MRTHWCGGLLLPAILLALTACGSVEFPRRAADPGKPPHKAQIKQPAPERLETLRLEIRGHLGAESYRPALELLGKGIKGGFSEADLAEEYVQAVNGVLGKAELYNKQGLPDKAGELYRSAHDGFPKTEVLVKKVVLTPPEILIRIEDCAGQLMERGLVAYRADDLDGAIKTWKIIQAFSPRHQASKKALETAEVQRTNLEKVSTKN